VENTQNELPLGGVEQPSQRTPGGVSTPLNGGSSEMHDWGVYTKSRGCMDHCRGGVENTLHQGQLPCETGKIHTASYTK